jgi:hypothetical protein
VEESFVKKWEPEKLYPHPLNVTDIVHLFSSHCVNITSTRSTTT